VRFLGTIGNLRAPEPTPESELRERRVLAARRSLWTEIPESRLVERGQFLVDAETDRLYTAYRGALFSSHGRLLFGDQRSDLVYAVLATGGIIVLEPATIARTWSDYCYLRERGAARASQR
jgi:hypothetical protein